MCVPDCSREHADIETLLGKYERHPGAGAAGATGSADAMDIVVGRTGRVEVDHMCDVVDIQSPRGDVGGDQR